MQAAAFEVGALVSSKSGVERRWLANQRMVVELVDGDGYVHCCWMEGSDLRRRCFAAAALVRPPS